jgi:hypothetical protein
MYVNLQIKKTTIVYIESFYLKFQMSVDWNCTVPDVVSC